MRNNYRDVADIPDITKVVPVSQGGFGGKNNIESAEALDVLRKSDIGQLIAPAPTQDKPLEVEGPDFSQPLLKGPSFIVQGLPFRYTILNPKPVGENSVSISEGSIELDGFDIVGTATSSLGSCTMVVNGREIHVPVREAKPMAPVLTCVHHGKVTTSYYIPVAVDGIKTSGYEDVLINTEYQISDDRNFSRILSKKETESDSITELLEASFRGKTLFFRARVKGKIGSWSDWSNIVFVTVETEISQQLPIMKIPYIGDNTISYVQNDKRDVVLWRTNPNRDPQAVQTGPSGYLKKVFFPKEGDVTSFNYREKTIEYKEIPGLIPVFSSTPSIVTEDLIAIPSVHTNSEGILSTVYLRSFSIKNDDSFGTEISDKILTTVHNISTQVLHGANSETHIWSFYSPGSGAPSPFALIMRLNKETGELTETQRIDYAVPMDYIAVFMATAISPDGLNYLAFDLTKTNGTFVRHYRRSDIDSPFTLVSNNKFSNGYTHWGRSKISSDGKFLIVQESNNASWTGTQTAKLYSIDFSNGFSYTEVDSIPVPSSEMFEYKTYIHDSNDLIFIRDSHNGNLTSAYSYSYGKFTDASWILSLSNDATFTPSIFDNGKMVISTDSENYIINV